MTARIICEGCPYALPTNDAWRSFVGYLTHPRDPIWWEWADLRIDTHDNHIVYSLLPPVLYVPMSGWSP